MTVWITKYWQTEGIIEKADAKPDTKNALFVTVPWKGGLNGTMSFYGNEWHSTLEAAQKHAEKLRIARIIMLKKQISKLENMRFEESE